jgi:hypothetical protein
MGSCATQTFAGVSPAQFTCLIQKASSSGITISGDEGQATRDGITVRWKFAPATGILELQCTDAPFFVPCDAINGRIQDLVGSCLTPSGRATG